MGATLSEQLVYSTVQIVNKTANGNITGTGFLFHFTTRAVGDGELGIVSNKHVFENAESTHLIFTIKGPNGEPILGYKHHLEINEIHSALVNHPDSEVDLCYIPMANIYRSFQKQGINLYTRWLTLDMVPNENTISQLNAVEDVTIVGYPNSLIDGFNNLPIVRRGITATDPKLNYNGKPHFLVDASIYPGSSGSPVVILQDGIINIRGNISFGKRMVFLGVIFQTYLHTANGTVKSILPGVPMATNVQVPNSIGIAVKAQKLIDFIPIINELLAKRGL